MSGRKLASRGIPALQLRPGPSLFSPCRCSQGKCWVQGRCSRPLRNLLRLRSRSAVHGCKRPKELGPCGRRRGICRDSVGLTVSNITMSSLQISTDWHDGAYHVCALCHSTPCTFCPLPRHKLCQLGSCSSLPSSRTGSQRCSDCRSAACSTFWWCRPRPCRCLG